MDERRGTPEILKGVEVAKLFSVEFPFGIPGFEGFKKFNIAEMKDNPLFCLLYSADEPEVSMIIMKCPVDDSNRDLYEVVKKEMGKYLSTNGYEVDVYFVVRLDRKDKRLVANYNAPIVICRDKGIGYQIILEKDLSELSCESSSAR